MPRRSCFRTPFDSKCVHRSQTLLEPALQHFYPNYPLIQEKFRCKTSFLVRSSILGLFGNTLIADHIYSRHRLEKLRQQVETILSQKLRPFSAMFIACLESTQNFAHFDKKDQLPRLHISEVIDPEKCHYFNARQLQFQNSLQQ